MDGPGRLKPRPGSPRQDDAAPPYGGAINPSYRQTAQRDVCTLSKKGGLEGGNRRLPTGRRVLSLLKKTARAVILHGQI